MSRPAAGRPCISTLRPNRRAYGSTIFRCAPDERGMLFILLFTVIFLFQPGPSQSQEILVTMDPGDTFAAAMLRHLNISFLYYVDLTKLEGLSIRKFAIPGTATTNNFCDQLTNTSMIISLCRSSQNIELVRLVAQTTSIPTIQINSDYWTLPTDFALGATLPTPVIRNYLVMVSPVTVFSDVITDIYPSLNIASAITVLYDDIYDPSYLAWQRSLAVPPFNATFTRLEPTDQRLRQQIMMLMSSKVKNIFLVAKTENVERFTIQGADMMEQRMMNIYVLTKDITAFKCDLCASAFMYWIRPYHTGYVQDVRDLNDFLARNEIGTELDYKVNGWDEVDVSFYMNVMNTTFGWTSEANMTLVDIPTFSCSSNIADQLNSTLKDIVLSKNIHEYGPYIQQLPNYFFENVEARIYKIDRKADEEEALYNKMLGSWTVLTKLTVLYGRLDVDVRTLNHYRIVTLMQPPFVEPSTDPSVPYEGYCIDLINLIKDEVNFTYSIYEVEDGSFGTIDDNGNWNGLIGALVSGSADIALAPLSVMAERENDVDFTVPYYDLVGTTILMKKADVEYSLFKFMKVLEWPVWLCIVAAYLFTSLLLWVFDRFSPYSYTNNKERYKDDIEKRVFSLKECLWFCMTSLTPQGGGEAPKNISGRLVAATWWLFGFIIIASYTANLAAFLTVSRLEQPISSLDDLAKQYKIEYAPIKGSASETYFRRMAEIEEQFYNIWKEMSLNESMSPRDRAKLAVWDYPVSDKFTNMWRYMQESKLPPNMEAAIDRVLNSVDGFAFIGDATEIKYAALTNCKLQQVGTEFSRKPYAIAVQTGHVLKDQISSAILMLLNQRRLETLKEKWWNDNPNKVNCPESNDESDGISIQNIGGVFIVILAGILLSVITLTFEYFYYRRKSPVTDDPPTEKEIKNGSPSSGSTSSTLTRRGNGSTAPEGNGLNMHTYQNGAFQY